MSLAGICGYRIWGKMGAQGKEVNSKPVVVTVKRRIEEKNRRTVYVRKVQWERRGGVGGC